MSIKSKILHSLLLFPWILTAGDFSLDVEFQFKQEFPGFSLNTQGKQLLSASIEKTEGDNLQFTLKKLKVDLKNNDQTICFDSSESNSSFYLNQVGKLIDHPILIPFEKSGTLKEGSTDLSRLSNQLPVLKEFCPEGFLAQILEPLLIFDCNEAAVGKKIKQGSFSYETVAIDNGSIEALITGSIPLKTITLGNPILINGVEEEVTLTLSGTIHGEGVWKKGSLESEIDWDVRTAGIFKAAGKEWAMSATTSVHSNFKTVKSGKD